MRIRSGFVSNSSTSSFLIYGTSIPEDQIENFNLDVLNDTRFDTYYIEYNEDVYIGMSWDSIKDDETGLQFKTNIENKLKAVFGDNIKCMTYEEAWYNG